MDHGSPLGSGNAIGSGKYIRDSSQSPALESPSQQFNFQAQNLNILVHNYDSRPSIEAASSIPHLHLRNTHDQLSNIEEDSSNNRSPPLTYSSNVSSSPAKQTPIQDSINTYDARIGAQRRAKLFTLQNSAENFNLKNKSDDSTPIAEDLFEFKGASGVSGIVDYSRAGSKAFSTSQVQNDLPFAATTNQLIPKRKTVASHRSMRSPVVTIRTPDMIWKEKFFFIMMYISRMVSKMKQVNIFRHPEQLYETQLNAISDKAAKDIRDDGWGQKDVIPEPPHERHMKTRMKNRMFASSSTALGSSTTNLPSSGKFSTATNSQSNNNNNNRIAQVSKTRKYFLLKYRIFRLNVRRFLRPYLRKIQWNYGQVKQCMSGVSQRVPVIDSMAWFSLVWSNLMFYVSLALMVYAPYAYCYNIVIDRDSEDILTRILLPVVFLMNIGINANTTYFERGNVINEHARILVHYARTSFIVDIASLIALLVPSDNVCILLLLTRAYLYRDFLDKFTDRFLLHSSNLMAYISIVKVTGITMLFAHISACIWYFIGYQLKENSNTGWLVTGTDVEASNNLYLQSLFTIVSSFTLLQIQTRISVSTKEEQIFLIIVGVASLQMFAYVVYEIHVILRVRAKRREEYLHELTGLSNYLSSHEVEPQLKERSRKYLEFMYDERQARQQSSSQESLNGLSNFLKREIITQVFLRLVKKIALFRKFFAQNPSFLEKLALRSKEITFGPDEIIVRQGSIEVPSLYLVTHGEIQLFAESGSRANVQQKIFKILKVHDCIGMYEFFSSNYEVQLTAKSLGVSRMLCITLRDMHELLREFPREREAFCFLKDSIVLKQDLSQIDLPCYSCHQVGHYVLSCPYLFYGTQPQKIIKEINKRIKHIIENFTRSKDRKRSNAKTIIVNVNLKASMIQDKYLVGSESSERDQYSSDTSIQLPGETSLYSSLNDIETHTHTQSRFDRDRKSILRVHSGSSKFTSGRQQRHKDSESAFNSRHEQSSREEKDINRMRPNSVSISKFGRFNRHSDLNLINGEDASDLKSAVSWQTRERRVSLSNNYELNTVGRVNSAENFNIEDSRRLQSLLNKRSDSDQNLPYENILQQSEEEIHTRRSQKRHSTHQTNKTNKTSRTNRTSKTTITKTLQQLEMDNSMQLNKSRTVSLTKENDIFPVSSIAAAAAAAAATMDIERKFQTNAADLISPIQNPMRKESQTSNSIYYNNAGSSNLVALLYNGSSQLNNIVYPGGSSNNPLGVVINNPSGGAMSSAGQTGGAAGTGVGGGNGGSAGGAQQNLQQGNVGVSNNSSSQQGMIGDKQHITTGGGGGNGNGGVMSQGGNMPPTGTINTNSNHTTSNRNLNLQQQLSFTQSQKFHASAAQPYSSHGGGGTGGGYHPPTTIFQQSSRSRSMMPIENIRSYSASIGTVKSFELYFPDNNVENIIERYNKLQRKRVSRRVRKKRTTQRRETKKRSHIVSLSSRALVEDFEGRYSKQFIDEPENKYPKSLQLIEPSSSKYINSAIPQLQQQQQQQQSHLTGHHATQHHNTTNSNQSDTKISLTNFSNIPNTAPPTMIQQSSSKNPAKKDIFNLNAFNLNDNFAPFSKPHHFKKS